MKRQDDENLTIREKTVLALLREAVESGRPSATAWLVVSKESPATELDVKMFRRRMLNALRRYGKRKQIQIPARCSPEAT